MPKKSSTVSELTNDQLRCHLYRHNFNEPGVFLEKSRNGDVWVLKHECRSCGVKRDDYCQPKTLQLLWRNYDYEHADKYLIAEPATTEDIRKEYIGRLRTRLVRSA